MGSLEEHLAAAPCTVAVLKAIQAVEAASNYATTLAALEEARDAVGADQAAFVSFIRDDVSRASFRFLAACSPAWCTEYQQAGNLWFTSDAWLIYAMGNSEPIAASRIPLRTKSQRDAAALAERHGVASAYIVPAPASAGLSRLGVLCLTSSNKGFFDASSTSLIKPLVRGLAMELHEWWVRTVRAEIIEDRALSEEDLEVLRLGARQMSTKEIARALSLSTASVDSRFQRINAKLDTPSRKAASRYAGEYGLI